MNECLYIIKAVGDVLLPRTCIVCGCRLDVSEKYLCGKCEEDIPLTYNWQRKYHPIADRFNTVIQRDLVGYEPYSFVANLFFYDENNGYRHICHLLKYHGNTGIGIHFGRRLGTCLAASPHFRNVDTVIPVPLHWKRYWSRGYNQAGIIGKAVASVLGAGFCPRLLVRKKNTVSQTTLDNVGKHENMLEAFTVPKRVLYSNCNLPRLRRDGIRHILVIDDVFTSGATMAACRSALRKVFPPEVRISVATLAAVDEDY